MQSNRNHNPPGYFGRWYRSILIAVGFMAICDAGALFAQTATPPLVPPTPPSVAVPAGVPLPPAAAGALNAQPAATQPASVPAASGSAATPAAPPAKPGSLFFSPQQLAAINDAMREYQRMKDAENNISDKQSEDYLSRLDKASNKIWDAVSKDHEPKEKSYAYPQFFLESLVYHGPADWVVRINQQMIDPQTPPGSLEFSIISVDKEEVSVEWKPVNMGKVMEVWNREPNKDVVVDSKRGTVVFVLHPNQTFSSYVMRVVEGKVTPMVVNYDDNTLTPRAVAAPLNAVAPEPKNMPPVNIHDDNSGKTGLVGLNNTYKRIGLGN